MLVPDSIFLKSWEDIRGRSGTSSHAHVLTNLYTIPNTKTLTSIKTNAVTTLAKTCKPSSDGCCGRLVDKFCFEASPCTNPGNARLWVNVNLCRDSDNEYGPTESLAAARKRAYSKSSASNMLYLRIIIQTNSWKIDPKS